MNKSTFATNWSCASTMLKRYLKTLANFPTPSNQGFVAGYLNALHDCAYIDHDTYKFFLDNIYQDELYALVKEQ